MEKVSKDGVITIEESKTSQTELDVVEGMQFNKGYEILFTALGISIIILLMITVSDFKYTIIPDQFTVALAVVFLAVVI